MAFYGSFTRRSHSCIVTLAASLLVASASPLSAQSLSWAKRAGGPNFDQGLALASDTAGNSYVTGWISGSATFGPGEPNERTIVTEGTRHVFVAKYGRDGLLQWVSHAATGETGQGSAISVDAAGNAYVTGFFRFALAFEDGTTFLENVSGVPDLFLAKYDVSGNLAWARRADPALIPALGIGIATDAAGNAYLTGAVAAPTGENRLFLSKFDSQGGLLWSRSAGAIGSSTPNNSFGASAAVDGQGNIYLTGAFTGTAIFGPGEENESPLTAPALDMFLARFDSTGDLVWVRQAGSVTAFVDGTAVALDVSGNPRVTGNFSGTDAVFGSGQPNEITLDALQQDVFVAKYGSDGQLSWVKQAGSNGIDGGTGISVDRSGHSLVIGGFVASATFGAGEVNETILGAGGGSAIFIANYDDAGMLSWAKTVTTAPFVTAGQAISLDDVGHAYVAGTFGNVGGNFADPTSATFGAGEPNQTVLTTSRDSGTEIFVARYNNDAVVTPDLDLDLAALRVTGRVRISRSIRISAGIRNNGTVNGTATLRIVGQRGAERVYDVVLPVADPIGSGATTIDFPSYVPTTAGDILWAATLADGDPDLDEVTATTRVVQ